MDAAGVSRSAYDDLGTRCVGRGSVCFDDVRVPAAARVGEPGPGFSRVMQGFDYSRALIGLQCLGAARASLDETWPSPVAREAFGPPTAPFPGVHFSPSYADAPGWAARQLLYPTLWPRHRG